jgi:hypothetical protein
MAGTGTREVFAKRFISSEHVKMDPISTTPGPGAYDHRVSTNRKTKSFTGKQADSTYQAKPEWGFGSADRFHVQNKTLKATGAIPGPGAYFT